MTSGKTSHGSQNQSLSHSTLSGLPKSTVEKAERFRRLPKERKIEIIRNYLRHFIELARKDNPIAAWIEFTRWLGTDDGAIIWSNMWKEEYREEGIMIGYAYLLLIEKSKPLIRDIITDMLLGAQEILKKKEM